MQATSPPSPITNHDVRTEAAVARLQTQVWSLVLECFEAQRKAGLTQAALAAQLGVPRGQVCIWLGSPEKMTIKAAARLLDAMGSSLVCSLDQTIPTQRTA